MSPQSARLVPFLLAGVGALLVVGLLAVGISLGGLTSLQNWLHKPNPDSTSPAEPQSGVELAAGEPDTIVLPPDVVRTMRIQTATVQRATQPRTLELDGWLALDANRLVRVHSRFAGEVMQVGEETDSSHGVPTETRVLRPGDHVKKGQLLAVVWSKDLGEKKSELVDALSQLRLDRETLTRLEELARTGATSEASVRQARRNYESDVNAVARAERTLRSWRLTEAEIDAVKAEAERIRQRGEQRDKEHDRDWAKVEVRAPQDGTILEKNVNVGDIVDTATDLYKIADLRTLAVWAHVYEDDLPALLALPPEQRTWEVHLPADPIVGPLKGRIERIGDIIDPNQHTALAFGTVDNAEGRLRVGEFITATVLLPPLPYEVLIPTRALIEDGHGSIVFIQEDPTRPRYTERHVDVLRRMLDGVGVRSKLSSEQEKKGLTALRPGEQVVSSGAVELRTALEELQAAAAPQPTGNVGSEAAKTPP
jgi:cobalt-zinc-cadmium efflux system membrane fusion protein